jgi:hypothetical protein
MKTCFKCGETKGLAEYYKHPRMGDGHLNKCKDCTRKDVKERFDILIEEDPEFIYSERLRGREKYHRLYKGQTSANKDGLIKSRKIWKGRYPEKWLAKVACDRLPRIPGRHRHHWSYNDEHFTDYIVLDEKFHSKLHRFITYDPKEKKYRTTENTLLETREMHEQYIKIVQEIF